MVSLSTNLEAGVKSPRIGRYSDFSRHKHECDLARRQGEAQAMCWLACELTQSRHCSRLRVLGARRTVLSRSWTCSARFPRR
jgi:hypothetical protein